MLFAIAAECNSSVWSVRGGRSWITLTRGVSMLLVTPEQQHKLIDYWRRDVVYYTAVAIVLVLNLYLARAGFAV